MSVIGIQMRLRRLFGQRNGKALIVAVDHGMEGRPQGLEHIEQTIRRLLPLGIHGLLLNPGMFKHYSHLFQHADRPAIILAGDMYINTPRPYGKPSGDCYIELMSVEECAAMGADAIKLVLVFGQSSEKTYAVNVEKVASTIERAHRLGMPVMLETVVWGQALDPKEWNNPEFIGHMMRIGLELGADMLKVPYAGPPEQFAKLVEQSPVPVTLLGGSLEDEDEVVRWAEEAVKAGVSGFVYGRNIWQHPEPESITKRLLNLL